MRLATCVLMISLIAAPAAAQGAAGTKRDSLWNGILIGAALGVLATLTTAAEAPPSGKVVTVISLAALGGYVDSRKYITRPFDPGGSRPSGWRLQLTHSINLAHEVRHRR